MIPYRACGFYLLLKRWSMLLIYCSISYYVKGQSNEWKSCVDSEYQKVYSLLSDSLFVESIEQSRTGTILVGKICATNAGQQGGFIVQLDSTDKVLWAKRYLSPPGN